MTIFTSETAAAAGRIGGRIRADNYDRRWHERYTLKLANRPTAAKGGFPYNHRSVAEMDAL